ncbi:hypothetical protein E2C01_079721 [Portunus trituberculatus]|uniref:Uncharacterized protein n=1 Tax=Portunus trituberculatus TaxID=210409 RepID=A0A5B7IR91_PORTR|nr:hypothetical protein [Portunus trituberculatus]
MLLDRMCRRKYSTRLEVQKFGWFLCAALFSSLLSRERKPRAEAESSEGGAAGGRNGGGGSGGSQRGGSINASSQVVPVDGACAAVIQHQVAQSEITQGISLNNE